MMPAGPTSTAVVLYLKNDASSAYKYSHCEYPEKKSVHDHGHVLPVLNYLTKNNDNITLRCEQCYRCDGPEVARSDGPKY